MSVRTAPGRRIWQGVIAAALTAVLATVSPPAAQAALPGPDSGSWTAVKKSGATLTDGAGDFATAHLDLTAAGGASGPATVFVAADLVHGSFRFHVASLPADAAGGYVVQFDTDGNTAGWERALRYDPFSDTIRFFTAGPNAGVKDAGTATGAALPMTAATATSYAGADGGAYVAFAVPRPRLTSAGITLGAPMVIGTTSGEGAALDAGGLLIPIKADVLGTPQFGLSGTPAWSTLVTDPLEFDSDGDGFVDRLDNCPTNANPGQEDDDQAIDNSLPPGTTGQPDGTEGMGNACDPTPRGYDADEDGVGLMDDDCPERPGLDSNGCVARSLTKATARYLPRATKFTGVVRADYDECVPRRGVSVFKLVLGGPDRLLGSVKTDAAGRYALDRRARRGKYYAVVDKKTIFAVGVICYAVKSPKIDVR